MNLEAGGQIKHYRLVEKLGQGGMGIVWKASDLKLERDIAIKFLLDGYVNNPAHKELFEQEARAAAALRHPNIVTIHSVEEVDGRIFFTMEYIDGLPLSRYIVPGGIPLKRFLQIAVPLAAAVAAAHEQGIIHRDLKPGNIMIGQEGILKILDFGLARSFKAFAGAGRDAETLPFILDSELSGTIGYMSPEQIRGETIDRRVDLFALGVVLFELATGTLPFAASSAADMIVAILESDPLSAVELNPTLPKTLQRALYRCLEKDVRYRMESARELLLALEELQGRETSVAASDLPAIAVLPFADMSREKDQAYFCEGIAEEIINALCRVEHLRVASRIAAFQFGDCDLDPREIGRLLRVETLLEGSVRKSGNRLRITAQLIDTSKGFHRWSEAYDREADDIFEIQEEIARAIVRALRVTLGTAERSDPDMSFTAHAQAHDYYLRGRSFYYRYDKRDVAFAQQLFRKAAELDPTYALAHAGIADCLSYEYLYTERSDDIRGRALEAGRRAVELGPDSAQAQASFALALSLGRDERAAARFEEAIRLDPDLFEARYFYARYAFALGGPDQGHPALRGGRPHSAGRLSDAAAHGPDLRRPRPCRGGAAGAEPGRGAGRRATRAQSRRLPRPLHGRQRTGRDGRDRRAGWSGRAGPGPWRPDDSMALYNLGCIYSLAGEADEALGCLERAVALGLTQRGWYEHDSNLDPLRTLPRFQALLAGLP